MKKILTFLFILCITNTAFAESNFALAVKQPDAETTTLDERTVPRVLILRTTPALLERFQNLKQEPNQKIAAQLNRSDVED